MPKKYGTYILSNISAILMIALTYLVYKTPNNIEWFGSSFILILIMAAGIGFSYIIRLFSLEFNFFSLIAAGIMAINYLASLEVKTNSLNVTQSLFFIGCILWVLFWFFQIFFRLLKPLELLDEPSERFRKQLALSSSIVSFAISLTFIAITYVTFQLLKEYNPQAIGNDNSYLRYTVISIGWLILALLVSLIYLLRIDDRDILNLIVEEKRGAIKYDVRNLKKYILIILFAVITLGSIFETQRGMWVMWIETISLLVLMSLILWKIYKHVFSTKV